MRAKEIEVWIKEADYNVKRLGLSDITYWLSHEKEVGVKYYRAKITVELPEQKLEISESDIRRAGDILGWLDSSVNPLLAQLGFKR